jgi:hypothetical protein
VEHDVGGADVERLADVALLERRRRVDVLALPGDEVVDHDDVVAAPDERVDEVRADEPRSPGHDRPHGPYRRHRCS